MPVANLIILIVEDERIIALDLRQKLRKLGYDVPCMAHNGRDAVRLAQELQPGLVLMDIMIEGDIDGIETARRIREHIDMPVIFVSACTDGPTRARAMCDAQSAFVSKPVEISELKACIETLLGTGR